MPVLDSSLPSSFLSTASSPSMSSPSTSPVLSSSSRLYDQAFRHALYDPNHSFLSYQPPPPQWNSPLQMLPANPYPPVQPPPVAHKVWILDCKSCGKFLTNRGMRAVLLLRPNVSLFSSDALPINCSAYTSNPDVLRPPTSCRPQLPARTCECLTQTLCCHGCGATVGYMIVIPCTRCTSSISASTRATNGHRFVFHSNEIVGSERHYIPDEPGVIPIEASLFMASSSLSQFISSDHSGYLPTPPLEDVNPLSSASSSPIIDSFPFSGHNQSLPSHSYTPSESSYAQAVPTLRPAPANSILNLNPPAPNSSYSEIVPPRKLKAGEVLYWHHLIRHGEIPGVSEDPRARGCDQSGTTAAPERNKIVHPKRMSFDR